MEAARQADRAPGVVVRPALPGEATAVAEIWRDGWPDGHLGHVPDELVAVRDEASFRTRAVDRIGDITVAIVAGEVAGFVMRGGDEVEQVYVAARHRGMGVADALMADAEGRIRDAGFGRAWLAVVAGNERARRFYERRGWIDEGPVVYLAPGRDRPIEVPAHRYAKAL
ncbi:MAG: GNAT family N-acetyltransferase [Chloroflexota bacterium]